MVLLIVGDSAYLNTGERAYPRTLNDITDRELAIARRPAGTEAMNIPVRAGRQAPPKKSNNHKHAMMPYRSYGAWMKSMTNVAGKANKFASTPKIRQNFKARMRFSGPL